MTNLTPELTTYELRKCLCALAERIYIGGRGFTDDEIGRMAADRLAALERDRDRLLVMIADKLGSPFRLSNGPAYSSADIAAARERLKESAT